MEKEFHASESPLKKSPLTVRDDGPTGQPEMQMVGSKVPMSHTPVEDFRSAVSEGTKQMLGSTVPLDRTPTKGWDSYPTPMSEWTKSQPSGK